MKKILLVLSLIPMSVHAFLNIESLRQSKKVKHGIIGSTRLRLNERNGNSDKTNMGASTLNLLKNGRSNYIFLADYQYGESFKREDTREGHLHFRYTRKMTEALSLEAYQQSEFNKFQSLTLRLLGGVGARVGLIQEEKSSLYLGIGGFYEDEDIENGIDQSNPRGNLYLSHVYGVEDRFNTSAVIYYQPNTENMNDYRLKLSFGLESVITEYFTQQISYSLSRDTFPPGNVSRTDSSLSAGIGIRY